MIAADMVNSSILLENVPSNWVGDGDPFLIEKERLPAGQGRDPDYYKRSLDAYRVLGEDRYMVMRTALTGTTEDDPSNPEGCMLWMPDYFDENGWVDKDTYMNTVRKVLDYAYYEKNTFLILNLSLGGGADHSYFAMVNGEPKGSLTNTSSSAFASYMQFVGDVVEEFASHPGIFAWETVNEASVVSQTVPFFEQSSQLVRLKDPNHIIEFDVEMTDYNPIAKVLQKILGIGPQHCNAINTHSYNKWLYIFFKAWLKNGVWTPWNMDCENVAGVEPSFDQVLTGGEIGKIPDVIREKAWDMWAYSLKRASTDSGLPTLITEIGTVKEEDCVYPNETHTTGKDGFMDSSLWRLIYDKWLQHEVPGALCGWSWWWAWNKASFPWRDEFKRAVLLVNPRITDGGNGMSLPVDLPLGSVTISVNLGTLKIVDIHKQADEPTPAAGNHIVEIQHPTEATKVWQEYKIIPPP